MSTPSITWTPAYQHAGALAGVRAPRRALFMPQAIATGNGLLFGRHAPRSGAIQGTATNAGTLAATRAPRRSLFYGGPTSSGALLLARRERISYFDGATGYLPLVGRIVGSRDLRTSNFVSTTAYQGELHGRSQHGAFLRGGAGTDGLLIGRHGRHASYLYASDPMKRAGVLVPDYPVVGSGIGTAQDPHVPGTTPNTGALAATRAPRRSLLYGAPTSAGALLLARRERTSNFVSTTAYQGELHGRKQHGALFWGGAGTDGLLIGRHGRHASYLYALAQDPHVPGTTPNTGALAATRAPRRSLLYGAPTSAGALLLARRERTSNFVSTTAYQGELHGRKQHGALFWGGAGTDGLLIGRHGRHASYLYALAQDPHVPETIEITDGLRFAASLQGDGTPNESIQERFSVGGAAGVGWIQAVRDGLRFADGHASLLDALSPVSERLGFRGVVAVAYKMLVQEAASFGSTPTGSLAYALQVADALGLVGGVGSQLNAQVAVAAALVFGDSLASVYPLEVSEGLEVSASAEVTLRAALKLLDALRVHDAVTPGVTWLVQHAETLAVGAAPSASAELHDAITEGFGVMGEIHLPDGAYLAWVVNTESRAFVKYRNFPFNSFAKIGNSYFGASSDGIYRLGGDNDAGAPIAATLRGALSDLGSSRMKRMPAMYVGYRADDVMLLKVIVTDAEGQRAEHVYRMEARSGALRENRVKLGRGLKSTYWGWELTNIDGADFALDSFRWYPVVLERRL